MMIKKGATKMNIKKTWKNKLAALGLALVGYLSMLPEKDATAFVFLLMFAIPLFFAKENYID